MNTITLKSSDIHCASCAASIESVVGKLEGVQAVTVDVGNQTATVEFTSPTSEAEIKSAVEDAGFEIG